MYCCRMSSNIFPWCTEYEFKQLKDQDAIAEALAFAGEPAQNLDFVKIQACARSLVIWMNREARLHLQY